MSVQVLVAGAGPVGLFMAASVARLGVTVRIVDKAPAPSDRSKALVIWPRTLELFDIQGTVAPFLAEGLKVDQVHLMAGGRSLARASLRQIPGPYPFGLFLPQSDTERLLAAELAQRGTTVERPVELLSFTEAAGRVTAVLRHADGPSETVAADWQALRNTMVSLVARLPAFQRRVASNLSELDLRYRESPLNGPSIGRAGGLMPGDRAPDCPLVAASGRKKRLYEKLHAGRFVLLAGEVAPAIPSPLAGLAVTAQFGANAEPYRAEVLYLIRPDGYLALTAPAARLDAVLSYLLGLKP